MYWNLIGKSKINRSILGILVSLHCLTAHSRELHLTDLPQLVRNNNQVVQAAKLDEQRAQQNIRVANSYFLPTVEIHGRWTIMNDDLSIDIPLQRFEREILNGSAQIAIDIDPPPITIREREFANAHASITQALYTGGKIKAHRQLALAESRIQHHQLRATEDQQITSAIQRYQQAVLSQRMIKSFIELKARLSQIHRISQSLIQAGMAAPYATLRTEVAMAEIQARIEEVQAQQKVVLASLMNILQIEGLEINQLHDNLSIVDLQDDSSFWQNQALLNRTEPQIAHEREQQAQALISSAKSELLPQVYSFGRYEILESELTPLEPRWAVGLGFKLSLTAGIRQAPELRRANFLQSQTRIAKERANIEIPLQIEQILAKVQGSRASLLATEKALELSREALRVIEVGFSSGQSSHLDVLSHFNDLEKLEIRRWQLIKEYNRHVLELYAACSDLDGYVKLFPNHKEAS